MEFAQYEETKQDSYLMFAPLDPESDLEVDPSGETNPLVSSIGLDFFYSGRINESRINDVLEKILVELEGSSLSDDILSEALKFADFALIKFLFATFFESNPDNDNSAKCLAYAANINEYLWCEFTNSHPNHIYYLVYSIKTLVERIGFVLNMKKPIVRRSSYLGYDSRDKKDYNIEGYDDEEAEIEAANREMERRNQIVMIFLLMLSQFLIHPLDAFSVLIENQMEMDGEGIESDTSLWDHFLCGRTKILKDPRIIELCQQATKGLLSFDLNEDATVYLVKSIVLLNSQFPQIKKTSDVVKSVIQYDLENNKGGIFIQEVLNMLNENGYPNMSVNEAIAALRFCSQVLNTKVEDLNVAQEACITPGYFYTNDVKVLLEVILRELINVPLTNDKLRSAYLNLIFDVICLSSWSTQGDYYLKNDIKERLEVIKASEEENFSVQVLAEEILSNQMNNL